MTQPPTRHKEEYSAIIGACIDSLDPQAGPVPGKALNADYKAPALGNKPGVSQVNPLVRPVAIVVLLLNLGYFSLTELTKPQISRVNADKELARVFRSDYQKFQAIERLFSSKRQNQTPLHARLQSSVSELNQYLPESNQFDPNRFVNIGESSVYLQTE